MSSPLVLAPTGHPPVPSDQVLIEVEVDYSRCGTPSSSEKKTLDDLDKNGLSISISQIVAYAGTQYRGAALDHWGVGTRRAEIQRAWENILSWKPRCEVRAKDKISKLVFDDLKNSRDKALLSEILAIGVGLIAASRVYKIPYKYWYPTPGLSRTDFMAPRLNGHVHLEVRGRFDRKNFKSAIEAVWDKFGSTPSIANELGAVFFPRSTPNVRTPDLILLDPEGPARLVEREEFFRALLWHYSDFYIKQGYDSFGGRLVELAQAGEREFNAYLHGGDEVLKLLGGQFGSWRTSFTLEGEFFIGTAWEASAVPHIEAFFTSAETHYSSGFLVWAIWEPIHGAIIEGDLERVASAELNSFVIPGDPDNGQLGAYVGLEDGTTIAWARNLDDLVSLP